MPARLFSVQLRSDVATVFEACRNVANWPNFMPAVKRATFIESTEGNDIVEITAEANSDLWTWQSRRCIRKEVNEISFERISPPEKIVFMRGKWKVEALSDGIVELQLSHEFRVIDGEDAMELFLLKSIESNARRDLQAIKEMFGKD
jgi:aromatase